MRRGIPAFLLVIGIVGLVWLFRKPGATQAPIPPPFVGPEDVQNESAAPAPKKGSEPLLGDGMLEIYGSEESTAKEDLELLGRFIDNVFLLVKNRDTREYATNEDLVLFLQGRNAYGEPYLGPTSPALNEQGQLVDRWGSPVIVHPVSQKVLELRFAGPDKKPYTEDDLTRPRNARQ